jgi:hypothetical protein
MAPVEPKDRGLLPAHLYGNELTRLVNRQATDTSVSLDLGDNACRIEAVALSRSRCLRLNDVRELVLEFLSNVVTACSSVLRSQATRLCHLQSNWLRPLDR